MTVSGCYGTNRILSFSLPPFFLSPSHPSKPSPREIKLRIVQSKSANTKKCIVKASTTCSGIVVSQGGDSMLLTVSVHQWLPMALIGSFLSPSLLFLFLPLIPLSRCQEKSSCELQIVQSKSANTKKCIVKASTTCSGIVVSQGGDSILLSVNEHQWLPMALTGSFLSPSLLFLFLPLIPLSLGKKLMKIYLVARVKVTRNLGAIYINIVKTNRKHLAIYTNIANFLK